MSRTGVGLGFGIGWPGEVRWYLAEEGVKRRTRIAQETFFSGRQGDGARGGEISTAQAAQHAAFLTGAGQAVEPRQICRQKRKNADNEASKTAQTK